MLRSFCLTKTGFTEVPVGHRPHNEDEIILELKDNERLYGAIVLTGPVISSYRATVPLGRRNFPTGIDIHKVYTGNPRLDDFVDFVVAKADEAIYAD